MHDFVHLLTLYSAAASTTHASTSSDSTVKVAVVTALGVVIAAAITAVASTFQRRGSSTPPSPALNPNDFSRDYVNGLLTDRRTLNKLQIKHAHLREACIERGMDPDDLIREQEQRR